MKSIYNIYREEATLALVGFHSGIGIGRQTEEPPENPRKNPRKYPRKNPQKTLGKNARKPSEKPSEQGKKQHTSWNQTRATLVGGNFPLRHSSRATVCKLIHHILIAL